MNYSTIESAYDFTNFSSDLDIEVILNKKTGEEFYQGTDSDATEGETLAEEDFDDDVHVYLPSKRDIDLGSRLVFKFASERFESHYEDIRDIFSRKRAYSKFRTLLERNNKLEEWRQFEKEETEKSLRKWCKENEIELED
ncbi:MAG: hypothetical protein HRT88_02435 [Lentisphaeraceae bacterium]|nr:hypothetical protein [Lentisphaeraceae bacterium]